MNLIGNLKTWLLPWNTRKENVAGKVADTPAEAPSASYRQLFADERKRMFSLNGRGEVTEWVYGQPAVPEEDAVKAAARAESDKPSRQQQMMQRLGRYLKLHYAFRYNLLTERTECARVDTDRADDSHHLTYTPVDSRTLNGIVLDAMDGGVDCWDRDVRRYVESDHVQAYHPFELYFTSWPNGFPTATSGYAPSTAGCWPSPPSGQAGAVRAAAPTVWPRSW